MDSEVLKMPLNLLLLLYLVPMYDTNRYIRLGGVQPLLNFFISIMSMNLSHIQRLVLSLHIFKSSLHLYLSGAHSKKQTHKQKTLPHGQPPTQLLFPTPSPPPHMHAMQLEQGTNISVDCNNFNAYFPEF